MRPLLPYRDKIRTWKESIREGLFAEWYNTDGKDLVLESCLALHLGDHQPRQDHELTPYGSIRVHDLVTSHVRAVWKAIRCCEGFQNIPAGLSGGVVSTTSSLTSLLA